MVHPLVFPRWVAALRFLLIAVIMDGATPKAWCPYVWRAASAGLESLVAILVLLAKRWIRPALSAVEAILFARVLVRRALPAVA